MFRHIILNAKLMNKDNPTPMILSIDTSSVNCTLVLSQSNSIIYQLSISLPNKHDKFLAEFTRRILSDTETTINDLDAIAITSGPGSFTGLRIGFSFAKGLVIDSDIKLILLPTLQLYALQSLELAKLSNKNKILSAIKGNSGKCYKQYFDLNNNPVDEIELIDIQDLQLDDNTFFSGDFEISENSNKEHFTKNNSILPTTLSNLAYSKFIKQEFADFDNFEPSYYQEFNFRKT